MKKAAKIISVFLALMLVLSSASVAFAKEEITPVIIVHGLGGSDIYENAGTPEQQKIPQYGLDVNAMLRDETIRNEAVKLFSDQRKNDYDKLFSSLGKYFENTNINCTPSGDAKDGQGIISYYTEPLSQHEDYFSLREFSVPVIAKQVAKIIGKKNVYAFNYDWRLDVCETAKGLRKTVEEVKKQTGAKKVTIAALSLGGAVVSAYMDAYKNKKDVKRYILINAAHQGLDVARLFEYDFKLDKKGVLNYLDCMENDYQGGSQKTLFRAISAFGDVRIGMAVDKLSRDVAGNKKNKKKFYLTVLKPWLGNIPALWECIPYSEFDKCVNKMSDLGMLDKKSGLYKKIKNYHKVQGRFKSNLKAVKKAGAEVAIIANYGTKGLPLTSKVTNHTDLVIDTKYASVGATVANYGKKLKKSGKYVSPDKIIDASSCTLPDNTWFIKGLAHGLFRYDSKATKLLANMICGKVKLNIKAVKKKYGYTQFLKSDENQKLTNIKK